MVIPPVRIHDDVGARLARVRRARCAAPRSRAAASWPATSWRWTRATRSASSPACPTTEPAFGLPAVWIADGAPRRGRGARLHGRRRRVGHRHPPHRDDPRARRRAAHPPGRRASCSTSSRSATPPSSRRSCPTCCRVGEVQRVLQALLREGVSIRDLGAIVEAVGDKARAHARPGAAGRVRPPGARPHDHRAAPRRRAARCARSRSTRRSSRRSPSRSRRPPTASSSRWTRRARRRSCARCAEPGRARRSPAARRPVLLCSARVRRHLRRLVRAGAAAARRSAPTTRSRPASGSRPSECVDA